MELTSITPSPSALKALSHPVRLRMLGLLRLEGPATATTLATRLGLNTGTTSYHLRSLARHGFVVDDPERGNARERWWLAAHQSTDTGDSPAPADTEAVESVSAFIQSIAVIATEQLQQAVEEWELLPDEWRRATEFSDYVLRLTPTRARRLVDLMNALVAETEEDADDTDGAAHFVVRLNAYPLPGTVPTDPT